jgi:hypothetical protein
MYVCVYKYIYIYIHVLANEVPVYFTCHGNLLQYSMPGRWIGYGYGYERAYFTYKIRIPVALCVTSFGSVKSSVFTAIVVRDC